MQSHITTCHNHHNASRATIQEPIFGTDDIQTQMPNEARKFRAVDATWRRLMERLAKQAEVIGGLQAWQQGCVR